MLLLLPAFATATARLGCNTTGNNIIVNSDLSITVQLNAELPDLEETAVASYTGRDDWSADCGYDGMYDDVIVVVGPSSLDVNDRFSGMSTMMIRSVRIFLQWLHRER